MDFESEVKVSHPSFGSAVLMMRDFSDGGMFVYTKDIQMPPIGSFIEVQALAFGENAPVLRAEIVRATEKGVGLMFHLDNGDAAPDESAA